jgi:hypothetical protein
MNLKSISIITVITLLGLHAFIVGSSVEYIKSDQIITPFFISKCRYS